MEIRVTVSVLPVQSTPLLPHLNGSVKTLGFIMSGHTLGLDMAPLVPHTT